MGGEGREGGGEGGDRVGYMWGEGRVVAEGLELGRKLQMDMQLEGCLV